jgi:hypothetical protein
MDKTIQGNWACNQPALPAYWIQLTRKPSAPFERGLHFSLENAKLFSIYFVFVHDFCL